MMKKYIFPVVILIMVSFFSVLITKCSINHNTEPQTVYVEKTVTDLKWDTVYQTRTVVEKLQVHDTLNQLVYRDSVVTDSVFVDLPILQYHADTLMKEGETELYLCISASGYKVSLDTISYGLSYTIPQPKKRIRGGFFIGPMVGVGWTGGNQVSPSVGIGIGFGFSLKKY